MARAHNKAVCACCGKQCPKSQSRSLSTQQRQWLETTGGPRNTNSDVLCARCRAVFYRSRTRTVSPMQSQRTDQADPTDCLILPFPRSSRSRGCCIFCTNKKKNLARLPPVARLEVFVEHGILVHCGVKCCRSHLRGKHLTTPTPRPRTVANSTQVTLDQVCALLKDLRAVVKGATRSRVDFDSPTLSDSEMLTLTGLTCEQFSDLVQHATCMRSSKLRSVRQAIGILLMKLRLGLSHRVIATLCGLDNYKQVCRIVKVAKNSLVDGFVPLNMGFNHITRESVINDHTTDFAISLFGSWISDNVILIMDGTYIYIQKSASYTFQRRCFSMHKHRPLLKPMMITSTDGYIVSVIGPYFADGKNNDANITVHMMKVNSDNMMGWLKEGDTFIVDRGFRDSIVFLNDCGFRTESPSFLDKISKQFDSTEANETRLVTKIRWTVESANGRLKRWRFFENVVKNTEIPSVKDYLQIVAGICNKYRPPLLRSKPTDSETADRMLTLAKAPNQLQERVESEPALKSGKCRWSRIEGSDVLPDWPKLSEDELREMTFGIYQLKQAASYIDELQKGRSDIFISKVVDDVIHARIQSRHTTSKQHLLWIACSNGYIQGWYCKCPVGSRTVGCCSHIASVLWYLSFARHHGLPSPADRYSHTVSDAGDFSVSGADSEVNDQD